ncbi:MAG: RidA family protein [Actinomycetales bacterium]
MGRIVDRIEELGLALPPVPAPAGSYLPALRSGSYVYTSGQIPMRDGAPLAVGKVGSQVTQQTATELAATCVLNGLAAVSSVADLDSIVRVVKVVGFVASDPEFTAQPAVLNGASDLLAQIFGPAGQHVRSAVGVAVLPLNVPVEVELVVEVRAEPDEHSTS